MRHFHEHRTPATGSPFIMCFLSICCPDPLVNVQCARPSPAEARATRGRKHLPHPLHPDVCVLAADWISPFPKSPLPLPG